MKKQNVVILIISVIALSALIMIYVSSSLLGLLKGNNSEISEESTAVQSEDESIFGEEESKEESTAPKLTPAEKLAELKKDDSFGTYWRLEKIVAGEIYEDAPRLDLETAKKIIKESKSFKEILDGFDKIQQYPDYTGGSGLSFTIYYFNNDFTEGILITVEQKLIRFFVKEPSDTKPKPEVLYDGAEIR